MQVRELSVFIFKLDKKTKIENENGKTVQSEPSCSISDILQSAVYWFCPFYTLQLSVLVRGFNSISQNRKNIFFIVFRHIKTSLLIKKWRGENPCLEGFSPFLCPFSGAGSAFEAVPVYSFTPCLYTEYSNLHPMHPRR